MRTFILIAALMALVAVASAGTNRELECMRLANEARLGESTIRKILEDLRVKLQAVDPLDVTGHHSVINNKYFSLDGLFSVHSTGLSGFLIEKLSLSLIGFNLKLQLRWPEVVTKGSYNLNLNSTLFPSTNVVGEGDLDLLIKNTIFKATGKLAVSIIGLNVQIKSLAVEMTMDAFDLKMTGLMFDEELSQNISTQLSENVPKWLVEYKDKVNQLIKDNLHIINDIIAGKKYFSEDEITKLNNYITVCGDDF